MIKKLLLAIISIGSFQSLVSQTWVNGQNAVFTLGSTSPSASGTISTNVNTFGPTVVNVCFAIDSKHNCMYVADFFGNRVLRFAYPITSNLPSANLVFGQSNFTNSSSGGLTQNGLLYPNGLAVDTASGTLWILSQGQNRILRFDNAHTITVNNPNANQVLGQPNFTSGAPTLSQNGISFNTGPQCANQLHYDNLTGALWVSDNGNIRVLRYDNAKTIGNGANANAVLGQSLYTTNTNSLSAAKFSRPDGLTTIGSSLFVADPNNNRVLRYDNVYSKPNGAPADGVIGQVNFTSNAAGTSATSLNNPTGLCSDQNSLFVGELTNKRITIFSGATTNSVATNVLLAPNFTTMGTAAVSPSTGGANACVSFDPVYGQLFVQDRTNNRILVFQSCVPVSINSPSVVCSGSSILLTGTGATTYTWNTSATTSTISVSPTLTTVYSFTSTSSSCTSTATKTITVNSLPTISVSSTSSLICTGNSATISASGASSYSWNTTSTVSAIAVTPTTTTSYTVSGTDANGCSNSSTFTQSVSLCTGILGSKYEDQQISIYPNPSAGYFTIKLYSPTKITIYNLIGEIILNETFAEGINQVNISTAANGIYFVRLFVNEKSTITKIVKQ